MAFSPWALTDAGTDLCWPTANCQGVIPLPETATQTANKQRRWNVILSGLLIGTLAVLVTFTSRAAFLSPTAIVVVAAVGLVALLLQLRFRYREAAAGVHVPLWLNLAGIVFALVGFFADDLHIRSSIAEVLALFAIGCFAVSGVFVLHRLRKQRSMSK